MDEPYVPIDCGVHDRLQLLAQRRAPCRLCIRDHDGRTRELEDHISDVYTRGREEYARLGNGQEVRLDRLLRAQPL